MLILNFAHPLTGEQREQIESICGEPVEEVREILTQFDNCRPLVPQIVELADACRLSAQDWQTFSLLIVLPSLSTIAVALLAEIHGRTGYFPPIVRICPTRDPPLRYIVTEIIDLRTVREDARLRRS